MEEIKKRQMRQILEKATRLKKYLDDSRQKRIAEKIEIKFDKRPISKKEFEQYQQKELRISTLDTRKLEDEKELSLLAEADALRIFAIIKKYN
jgi:hypothetical protein